MAYQSAILTPSQGGTGVATFSAGILVGNGTSNLSSVSFAGTANQISVSNATGVSGNPTYALTSTIYVSGISFDSGSNSISAYASGTFTPALDAQTSSPTVSYSAQVGYYQKVGNKCCINAYIALSSISGGSGNSRINLPITSLSGAGNRSEGALILTNVTYSTNTYAFFDISNNALQGNPRASKTGAAANAINITSYTSSSIIQYSAYYNI